MRIKIPLSEKTEQLLPTGDYVAEINEVSPGTANTGTKFLRVVFEIVGPDHEGAQTDCQLYLTERAAWKLNTLLAAAGVEPQGDEIETAELLGSKLHIHVNQPQDSSGQPMRPEVTSFRRLDPTPNGSEPNGQPIEKPKITDDDVPF